MKVFFLLFQSVIAVVLIGLILLQTSKGGLGNAFGGADYYRTKRGAERIVFMATVVAAALFLLSSVINLMVR